MAIPWMVLLKSVPWTDVIRNAPKVAEAARKLWTKTRADSAAGNVGSPPAAVAEGVAGFSPASESAALRSRLAVAEAELRDLHEQVLQSSELLRLLAEQHQGLVARVELNRRRTVVLAVVTAASAALAIAAIVLVTI